MSVQYKSNGQWNNISTSSNNAVDTVADGNMNPVTSNAVYDALNLLNTGYSKQIPINDISGYVSGSIIAYVKNGWCHVIYEDISFGSDSANWTLELPFSRLPTALVQRQTFMDGVSMNSRVVVGELWSDNNVINFRHIANNGSMWGAFDYPISNSWTPDNTWTTI